VENGVYLTIFDFDTSEKGMAEQITVTGMESWVEGEVPEINADGAYVFTGNLDNVEVENPDSRYNLTASQMDASVGLVYPTSEWEIKFGAVDLSASGAVGGRNFLFAGRTQLEDNGTRRTTTTTTCVRDDDGVCVVYSDPHIDGFDNPANGPFLTRVAMFDSFLDAKHRLSLLGATARGSWNLGRRDPTLDVNVYDRGDFWLVKNHLVHIQGRYNVSVDFGADRSGLSALAIGGPVVGGGKLVVEPKNGAITVLGHKIGPHQEFSAETTSGKVRVKTYYDGYTEGGVAPGGVDITLPSGIFVQVRRYNTHLDAKINMPHSAGLVDGQCGNFNGDPHDDSLEQVQHRMTSTKVSPVELLFGKVFQ
jgi:hypothetical protein